LLYEKTGLSPSNRHCLSNPGISLPAGCEENVILVWAAAAEGIMHNKLLPFIPMKGIILHIGI